MKNPYITRNNDKPKRPFVKWIYYALLLLIPIVYFLIEKAPVEQTTWYIFKQKMLLTRDVDKIIIVNKETAEIYLKKASLQKSVYSQVARNFLGMKNPGPHYYIPIGSVEVFEQDLKEAQLQFAEPEKIGMEYINVENNGLSSLLKWIVSIGVFVFLWFFIMRKVSSGTGVFGKSIFDFGKSSPGVYEKGKNNPVTFKDVAG